MIWIDVKQLWVMNTPGLDVSVDAGFDAIYSYIFTYCQYITM